ncbi:MAG: Cu(I)-responsive transcriptional regulator [Rhizobiales bacterium]|nr:Cu(I)-responsive transcriptional regulator [Hyphomicrobiales bacterium]MBO6700317.1 Cu(I)-responsive transcriptional regulator [Hyphomicrobiales bacterium]MBO6737518.1 Cu(I)-responsive transcriptional regulator [Hyphomicrobiales bacterium]MBO6913425.1 Cu(I)-responsive transcriptional regulator [Hyphomicrobiales bacterium]MBO6955356.1 Cu(I)-responsive transcriptional regulator [Hyphomicrobiales bacterium]
MNIGQAADRCKLPAKTIRYYEQIGLVRPSRADNGYRDYSGDDVHRLAFIGQARGLGFNIEECRQLLSLYYDKSRASADVKALATDKIVEIDCRLAEMRSLRKTLTTLVESCAGDDRPECPILDDLAKDFEREA